MNIKVNLKQLGSKKDKLKETDFYLEKVPHTVGELITESVRTCAEAYNMRVRSGERAEPLSEEEISAMSEIGKVAFGINYGGKEADIPEAVENALQSYRDGLFCIFIGEERTGELDEKISLDENNIVTFIKLTMLTGRLW
ncbi:MAG: hypothetical protein ACI4K7_02655 [Oscillospiraceae bacterium]